MKSKLQAIVDMQRMSAEASAFYFFLSYRERDTEKERGLSATGLLPNVSNGHGYIRPKPGVRSFIQFSPVGAGTHGLGHIPLLSQA